MDETMHTDSRLRAIDRMLNPRSIAIVGASDKIGPGFNAWNALKHVGFGGTVYLVNPTKTELLGQRCYPSLDAIDSDVDAAFVAVKAENVLEVAKQAAAKKAGGMAILSSGFGDAGREGLKLQNDLAAFAAQSGLSVCGPNCLGGWPFFHAGGSMCSVERSFSLQMNSIIS